VEARGNVVQRTGICKHIKHLAPSIFFKHPSSHYKYLYIVHRQSLAHVNLGVFPWPSKDRNGALRLVPLRAQALK
jgi:hypothetical protein